MKIVSINAMTEGSTGKIMLQIASSARKEGMEAYTCLLYTSPSPRDRG